jgi:hypothetical protein
MAAKPDGRPATPTPIRPGLPTPPRVKIERREGRIASANESVGGPVDVEKYDRNSRD